MQLNRDQFVEQNNENRARLFGCSSSSLNLALATHWTLLVTVLFVIIQTTRTVLTPLSDWGFKILRLFQ
jgi:hypothetical protein